MTPRDATDYAVMGFLAGLLFGAVGMFIGAVVAVGRVRTSPAARGWKW